MRHRSPAAAGARRSGLLTNAGLTGDIPPRTRPTEAAGSAVRGELRPEQFVRAPFRIVRPFDLDDGSVLLQLTHVAPGLCAGDAYRLDVVVESGARVALIGASATKVHRMPLLGAAEQTVTCAVMAGGAFEYYPGLVIPFPGSEFVQALDATLMPGARFGMLEVWAMGRIERGEYLAFRRLSSRVRVRVDDRPCYLDALELRPDRPSLAGWGMLEGHRYVASGYWHWDAAEDAAAPAVDIAGPDLLLVSGAPAAGGLYLRGLARNGVALGAALSAFLRTRRAAWGLSPLPFERVSSLLPAGDRATPGEHNAHR